MGYMWYSYIQGYIHIYIVCTYIYEPYGMDEAAVSCQCDMPRGHEKDDWREVPYFCCMSENNDILHRDKILLLMIHIRYTYNNDLSSISSISSISR